MRFILTGILLLEILIFFSCNTQTKSDNKKIASFFIAGNIQGMDTGYVFLSHTKNDTALIDTAYVRNGKFTFKGKATEPGLFTLTLENNNQSLDFFVENANIHINAVKDSINWSEVKGSKSEEQYLELQKLTAPFEEQKAQLSLYYSIAEKNKSVSQIDSLIKVWYSIDQKEKLTIADYCKNNSSIVCAYVVFMKFINRQHKFDINLLSSLFNGFNAQTQNSYYGKKIKKAIETAEKLQIGANAPDFTENTSDDKLVSLSSLKGKAVLLDFWASWCGPCRAQNPSIVNLYNKYNKNNFTIVSVSFDTDKELWIKAIQKDKLNWINVSDLQTFYSNKVGKLYNIQAIPTNYLIDKKGKIIGQELSIKQLDSTLQNITNN